LLSPSEINWVNDYHEEVWEKVSFYIVDLEALVYLYTKDDAEGMVILLDETMAPFFMFLWDLSGLQFVSHHKFSLNVFMLCDHHNIAFLVPPVSYLILLKSVAS